MHIYYGVQEVEDLVYILHTLSDTHIHPVSTDIIFNTYRIQIYLFCGG